MNGDFSRRTFARGKYYRAVLLQQGRIQLDADYNESNVIGQTGHAQAPLPDGDVRRRRLPIARRKYRTP
jgi:hypothetical protein